MQHPRLVISLGEQNNLRVKMAMALPKSEPKWKTERILSLPFVRCGVEPKLRLKV